MRPSAGEVVITAPCTGSAEAFGLYPECSEGV